MKRPSAALSTVAAVALFAGLILAAAGSIQGTATYKIQVSVPSSGSGAPTTRSFTFTETVSPGSNSSYETLFLAIASSGSNLTYTRAVNSSDQLLPFLPAITNQSFSYNENGSSVSASVQSNGTAPITFQGKAYTLTSYSFGLRYSISASSLAAMNLTGSSSTGRSGSVTGSILTFQSGLVYSVRAGSSGASALTITLLSTNLPLNGPSASTATQVASLGIGAGAIVSALALGIGVRRRHGKQTATESKPDHWVD